MAGVAEHPRGSGPAISSSTSATSLTSRINTPSTDSPFHEEFPEGTLHRETLRATKPQRDIGILIEAALSLPWTRGAIWASAARPSRCLLKIPWGPRDAIAEVFSYRYHTKCGGVGATKG